MSKITTIVNALVSELEVAIENTQENINAMLEVGSIEEAVIAKEVLLSLQEELAEVQTPGSVAVEEQLKADADHKAAAVAVKVEKAEHDNRNLRLAARIHNRRQVDAMRPMLNKKGKGIHFANFKVVRGENVFESVLLSPHNVQTELLNVVSAIVKTGPNTVRSFERFTTDFVNFDFSEYEDGNIDQWGGTIYLVGQGFERTVLVNRLEVGTLFNVLTHKVIDDSIVFNADGSLKEDVLSYSGEKGWQDFSTAQGRKDTVTFFANNDKARMEQLRSFVTYGATEILDYEDVTLSGLVKTIARYGQYKSPSCFHDALVGTKAIYCSEWADESGNLWNDGGSHASDRFIASVFNRHNEAKYVFETKSVVGLPIQARPWTDKIQLVTREQAFMTNFIEFSGKEIVYLSRATVTTEDQLHFDMLFDKATRKSSKFYNTILVVTNGDHKSLSMIDVYSDLNGTKCTYNLKRTSGINILDIGKVAPGVHTSSQMLQTLLFADPVVAKEWIIEKAIAHQEAGLDSIGFKSVINADGKTDIEFVGNDSKVPSISEMENLYIQTTLPKISAEFCVEKHALMFRTIADNFIKGQMRDIGKLHFAIDGANLKIVPDYSMLYNVKHLKAGEVYCPAAEEYFTGLGLPESEWFIALFKYPKMHVREFGCDLVVSEAEMAKRITASELTNVQKFLLKKAFKTVRNSIVMVPALEINKKKLAGMDYDADALSAVFDVKFVTICRTVNPLAINIIATIKAVESKNQTLSSNAGWKVFKHMFANGNKSIGEISIDNDIVVALLIGLLQGKLVEESKAIMAVAFKGKHIVESYESPLSAYASMEAAEILVQDVSEELAQDAISLIESMTLTKDNMIKALLDLNAVCRMYQEGTIDAAKTNTIIKVAFEMSEYAKLLSRTKLEMRINWKVTEDQTEDYDAISDEDGMETTKNGILKFNVDNKPGLRRIPRGKKYVEIYHVMDEFQEIRIELAHKISATALKLAFRKQEFTELEMAHIKEVAGDYRVGETVKKAIIEAKLIYDDLTGVMTRESKGSDDESKKVINAKYRESVANLSNHIRVLTVGLSATERARLMIDIGGKSNFAFVVTPEEFILFVTKAFGTIDFAGERLDKCDFAAGEEVIFVGGLAADGKRIARTKAGITGEFMIREYNGSLYASKLIENMVQVPVIDRKSFVVKTHSSEANNVERIMNTLKSGTVVNLDSFDFGGNTIVVNDRKVAKYSCQGIAETKAYGFTQGIVKECVAGETKTKSGKIAKVLVITIVEVKKLSIPKDKEVYVAQQVAKRIASGIIEEKEVVIKPAIANILANSPFSNMKGSVAI